MGTRLLTLSSIVTVFLTLPTVAAAQQPAPAGPRWDLAVTAGSFSGLSTADPDPGYDGDWHHTGEWRVNAGHYWTPHLKAEIEFGATGEGDRYRQHLVTLPGSTTQYPYSAQEFVRIRQGSARMTWQFLDNQWIHPYLSAGVSVDQERTRTHVYSPVYFPDPRNPTGRVVGTAEHDEPARTLNRPGLVLAGGAKWYVSPAAFIKTGVQAGVTRQAQSISFMAGMGFDW